MKILILGITGMIGRSMFKVLQEQPDFLVSGSIRGVKIDNKFPGNIHVGFDLSNLDSLTRLFQKVKPNVVINCVGLTKHLPDGNDPIPSLVMNALLPHRLKELCAISNARLIHVSTDCVFSGRKGNYTETDETDPLDVYGKTKAMGEVVGENVLTLRTSTIGHEQGTQFGLLEWFLSQNKCNGFKRAIFSGLPTVEFARIVKDIVIPDSSLNGIYNVGAAPIDKFSLLNIIAKVYGKNIAIDPDDQFVIDRSLNVDKFTSATGYHAPDWSELIVKMSQDYFLEV